ncbi:MAG: cysteine desulfurase [Mycoplasma sp.]|nr:cysteine desulfurase [Mycoplasma sp.]
MNRKDFELLKNVVYLDHSASALKPNQVIEAGVEFYKKFPINPHSIDSKLGSMLYTKIKNIRNEVAKLNNVKSEEVIFTSGTTDGINQIANMFENNIKKDEEIVLNYLNHSSNVIPWMELAKKTGAKIIWTNNPIEVINEKTKIVAISEINNTIGEINYISKIYKLTQKYKAYLINDAAQTITHKKVDAQLSDFVVWSANKLYGPTGTGVLIMKEKTQKEFPIVRFGGGAISTYNLKDWIPKELFYSREPGTPNTSGIIMLGAALEYINKIGLKKIWDHEKDVAIYAYEKLSELENIKWVSKKGNTNLVFNIGNFNSQDVVSYLGHNNIIARAGQHCVKILKEITGSSSWIRVSIGLYNEKKDIDKLFETIKKGGDFLEFI